MRIHEHNGRREEVVAVAEEDAGEQVMVRGNGSSADSGKGVELNHR
jgi:hypothetical protein